ncbi:MAG: recombinase zinc beta ribbon domain-containing protein [Proteobacteria bacterium]|nr:recombinase zinc beta ribbon domain-containing protein [Pseudomonadota bacterium]
MTLRTGKGGRYRYYTCNTAATEGKTACKGRNIRMERLDDLILDQLESRIFRPERLETLLSELLRRNEKNADELLL